MPEPKPSFEPGRRLRAGSTVVIGIVAFFAIAVMINYWAAKRLDWRLDLAARTRPSLSPLTIAALTGLTNEVKAVMLFSADSDLFTPVRDLLREYARLSPRNRFKLEQVDYNRNPNLAQLLKAQYHLGDVGDLVILDGGASGFRLVTANEMSSYDADIGAMLAGKSREIRRVGFRGESLLTSALTALADATASTAYFLGGHGAQRPDDKEDGGYYQFAQVLEERNVAWHLLTNNLVEMPKDCQLLIVAGASETLFPFETTAINRYLKEGGRALFLLNYQTTGSADSYDRLLAEWGVELPPQIASDPDNNQGGFSVLASQFGSHPITSPLARSDSKIIFVLPRVVGAVSDKTQPADAPKATVLITTGAKGGTKSLSSERSFVFTPGRDVSGVEVPLAVAVEKGGVNGVNAARSTSRFVVVGDSFVFANNTLKASNGNRQFASLTISWLLDRSQALAIGPRPMREYRLDLNDKSMRVLWIALAGVLPGIVLLSGIVVWLRRRA